MQCSYRCVAKYSNNSTLCAALFLLQYLLWNIVSIGLNVLVVLMYNHIGLLTQVSDCKWTVANSW